MSIGCVTEIQRYSTHEGPGIRTTVFFKGCQMNCQWCHNPETINSKRELMYYMQKCIGCRLCERVCPEKAHAFIDGIHTINFERCTACGACVEQCWYEALLFSGKAMTSNEVFAEILEDKAFYGEEGGVTISGGEPFLQLEFLTELLENCKDAKVCTAVETNLYHPIAFLEKVIPFINIVICDIKTMNDNVHRHYTGVSNELILDNIIALDSKETPIIIRTPLISGINDSVEDARLIGNFISKIKYLKYYEVLPYHPLGLSKSRAMGKKEIKFKTPSNETIQAYLEIIKSYDVTVFIGGEK